MIIDGEEYRKTLVCDVAVDKRQIFCQGNEPSTVQKLKEEEKTFDDVKALKVLYAKATSISRHIYKIFKNLMFVEISHSKIEKLYESTFSNIEELIDLNLSHNKLKEIPAKVFDKNTKLIRINLEGNQISSINSEVFLKLWNLKIFIFKGNVCDTSKDLEKDSKISEICDNVKFRNAVKISENKDE